MPPAAAATNARELEVIAELLLLRKSHWVIFSRYCFLDIIVAPTGYDSMNGPARTERQILGKPYNLIVI